jgi:hypothetical protein
MSWLSPQTIFKLTRGEILDDYRLSNSSKQWDAFGFKQLENSCGTAHNKASPTSYCTASDCGGKNSIINHSRFAAVGIPHH